MKQGKHWHLPLVLFIVFLPPAYNRCTLAYILGLYQLTDRTPCLQCNAERPYEHYEKTLSAVLVYK
jgi:hypothetical protein